MAQLVGLIVSQDDAFKKHFGRLLRAGAIPISVIDDRAGREGTTPDVVIVDARGDASSAMSNIERLRASASGAGLFAVASVADPNLILQSMRAGANEFFAWPPDEETFHGAVRRTDTEQEAATHPGDRGAELVAADRHLDLRPTAATKIIDDLVGHLEARGGLAIGLQLGAESHARCPFFSAARHSKVSQVQPRATATVNAMLIIALPAPDAIPAKLIR